MGIQIIIILKERIKMNNTKNTNDLNWNGLTDKQQKFIEKIVNDEVLTLCNELVDIGFKYGIQTRESQFRSSDGIEVIEFDNSYHEEGEQEGEFKEMMQFFIVSDWLARHLRNNKACVSEFLDFQIWGRCEYGQSLTMDHDLKEVVKSLA